MTPSVEVPKIFVGAVTLPFEPNVTGWPTITSPLSGRSGLDPRSYVPEARQYVWAFPLAILRCRLAPERTVTPEQLLRTNITAPLEATGERGPTTSVAKSVRTIGAATVQLRWRLRAGVVWTEWATVPSDLARRLRDCLGEPSGLAAPVTKCASARVIHSGRISW